MIKIRLGFAAFALLLAMVLGVLQLYQSQWLAALSILLTGFVVAFTICVGFASVWNNWPEIRPIVMLIMMLDIAAVFLEHPGFDTELQKAHSEASSAILMPVQCRANSLELQALMQKGRIACATQAYVDITHAAVELNKAQHLGPMPSLADQAIAIMMPDDIDRCAESYQAISKICPEQFFMMNTDSKRLLYEKQ